MVKARKKRLQIQEINYRLPVIQENNPSQNHEMEGSENTNQAYLIDATPGELFLNALKYFRLFRIFVIKLSLKVSRMRLKRILLFQLKKMR